MALNRIEIDDKMVTTEESKIHLEMEVYPHEEHWSSSQENDALAHVIEINVSNKSHVVGILFDIDSFRTIVAIVCH